MSDKNKKQEEKSQEKEKVVLLIKPAPPTEELPKPSKPDTINFSVDEAKEKKKKEED